MRVAVLIFICVASTLLRAQFLTTEVPVRGLPLEVEFGKFHEVDRLDLFPADGSVKVEGLKNPFVAAGLSLILPGLGEYYVGDQLWRGAIFTVVDAGLWFGHFTYLGRGEDTAMAFHAFADENWKPSRYADTLNNLLQQANLDYRIEDGNNFSQINHAEDTLSLFVQGFPISHRLPPKGSQQYYELISKYLQFSHGWIDHESGGPSRLSLRHVDMRANMNYQYEVADYFLFGLLLNRVLSAVDAVLLTRDHNSAIRLQGELRTLQGPAGTEFVPTAKLKLRF